jgi:hypothetical protein
MLAALAVAGRWLRGRLGPAFAEPDDVRGDVDILDEPDA